MKNSIDSVGLLYYGFKLCMRELLWSKCEFHPEHTKGKFSRSNNGRDGGGRWYLDKEYRVRSNVAVRPLCVFVSKPQGEAKLARHARSTTK